jgi:hypothetical protein
VASPRVTLIVILAIKSVIGFHMMNQYRSARQPGSNMDRFLAKSKRAERKDVAIPLYYYPLSKTSTGFASVKDRICRLQSNARSFFSRRSLGKHVCYTGSDSCFLARIVPLSNKPPCISPLTSHQSLWSRLTARALLYAVNAIAICRPLVGEVGTESEAGSIELLPVREVR